MSKSKHRSRTTKPFWVVGAGLVALILIMAILVQGHDVALFSPKGLIADEQHHLMLVATLILLGIAVPSLALLYSFAWKYREGSKKAIVNHHSKNSKLAALLIWSIPTAVMLVLASLMLPATQKLEPQKSIAANNKPITIQVVALRWKWLFIYPDQKIATLNYVQIPVNTPVQFELTADEAPMNSFWIPHLGGQLYAMTGHQNRLNLMATTPGNYEGSAAEINGAGFTGMRFMTRASSKEDFDHWLQRLKLSPSILDRATYNKLLVPSKDNKAVFYSQAQDNLYSSILIKYSGSHHHEGQQ